MEGAGTDIFAANKSQTVEPLLFGSRTTTQYMYPRCDRLCGHHYNRSWFYTTISLAGGIGANVALRTFEQARDILPVFDPQQHRQQEKSCCDVWLLGKP